ncbi:hypothetical protein LSUE1_G002188 [Lachnellula suecica]|uniref:Fibronectin type-III domain-containing protein n=1 Tax=Lachnellula suecica TaxID=602035 RepID=A0A8T9CF43_9HELO|nr:hypothetical protein LSUE1_G002188 [Lachnellula suecica]
MQMSLLFLQISLILTTLVARTISDGIAIEAEKLVDWIGCDSSTTSPQDIRDAWDSAMDIAYVQSGHIEWDYKPSHEFLAGPYRNVAYQDAIKAVLNKPYTARRAYWWNPKNWGAWKTSIRCDDPDGTCAKYSAQAAAYTINPGKRPDKEFVATKDTIVICPKIFNQKPTCKQALKDNSGWPDRNNLQNFQCRERPFGERIIDIDVRYKSGFDDRVKPHAAYGPVRTKVLALWPKDDVGKWVLLNGTFITDNLAQYSLAAWVSQEQGLYPTSPIADGKPDTQYDPKFFNETDAANDPTFDGWIEDNTNDPGFDESADIGPDVLLQLDTETYLDCNNNGNMEWATAPFVSQAFAESSLKTFCDNINSQSTEVFPAPGTADTMLFLGAILQIDDPTCTSLKVSSSDCLSQLGQTITGCDTSSTSRKYGGIGVTECISWVAVVNGTRAAVRDLTVPFSCSLLVADDFLNCACTDGGLYPMLNETCAYTSSPFGSQNSTDSGQQIAVAAYINPLGDPAAWTRMINYPAKKMSVLIANVMNGPDTVVDPSWANVISAASSNGKTVIGYVRTGYLGVSQQGFTTRLGSKNLADWTAQIETDVDLWYTLYPGHIGGIFFDEGWNDCGPDNVYSELYRQITENTKRKYPGAFTVLNPGSTMPQCFVNSADTLLTFESSWENYQANYIPNDWTAANWDKIWHIIYNVPQGILGDALALSSQRGAGLIHIIDDILPNPYDTLPSDSYMQQIMTAINGGSPQVLTPFVNPVGLPAATPGALSVVKFEYTSVTLRWSSSANAIGYKVYLNGVSILELAASMTQVTVGNLAVGTSGYTFAVSPVGGDGSESGKSSSVSSGTQSPSTKGRYVINTSVTNSASSTTYKADIIVPYAFVRVYIWASDLGCDWTTSPGWPINYNTDSYVCAHYMIEGETLYQYSGVVGGSTQNAPWSWTQLGPVPVVQSGYTYTWTVPIGTSTN